jgi:hypothetical protein
MLTLVPASADDEGTSTDEREVGTYPTYEEALFSFNDAGTIDRMITSFVVIVQDLLTRPYWRRIWIAQETILATNLELQYGDTEYRGIASYAGATGFMILRATGATPSKHCTPAI